MQFRYLLRYITVVTHYQNCFVAIAVAVAVTVTHYTLSSVLKGYSHLGSKYARQI